MGHDFSVADELIGPVILNETSKGALIVPGPALNITTVTVSVADNAQPETGDVMEPKGNANTASFCAKELIKNPLNRISVNHFFIVVIFL